MTTKRRPAWPKSFAVSYVIFNSFVRKPVNLAFKHQVWAYAALSLGLALTLALARIPSGSAQEGDAPIRMVQTFEADRTGLTNPAGLAFSARANALLVIQRRAAATEAEVVRLNQFGDRAGSARIAAQISDPINTAFDSQRNRLLILRFPANQLVTVDEDPNGELDPGSLVRYDVRHFSLQDPQGMSANPGSDDVYILDAAGPRIVHVEPDTSGGFEGASVSTLNLSTAGLGTVRGLTFDPHSGHLFVTNPVRGRLYELDQAGQVLATRDLSGFDLGEPRGMVFAPSGDQTDDSEQLSLYVADSGRADEPVQAPLTLRRDELNRPSIEAATASQSNGQIVELSLTPLAAPMATTFSSSLVRTVNLAAVSPPSPDPSGLAYVEASNTLMMDDGEVEETVNGITHFEGANVWELTLLGSVVDTANISKINPTSVPMSNEPTGVAWNPANGHYYFSDDSARDIFDLNPGNDGRIGTADDSWTSFDTAGVGSGDPEGVAFNTWNGHIFVADGVNTEVYEFTLAGSLVNHFDVSRYGVADPEAVEFNPDSGTLYVMSSNRSSSVIVETTTNGDLIQTIDISASGARTAAGLAYGPASNGSGVKRFYIVDRGVDNNSDPNIVDGNMYEMTAPGTTTPGNTPPVVDAGPDQTTNLSNAITLAGTVSDDGLPNGTLTVTWSKASGPGTVTFSNPSAATTTASFSAIGTYILNLTASDGQLSGSDELTVTVTGASGELILDVRISASTDDAEESPSGSIDLTSSDLELVYDGGNQTVGMRFNGINIPQGAAITNAYIQFQVDETGSAATALSIQGEDVDNALTFTSGTGNISARPRTAAAVSWNPNPWPTMGAAGADQRTPNLAAVVQEIIARPGWSSGNSLAIIVTGTGKRTAESYNGASSAAALLHIEYNPDSTNTPPAAANDAYTTNEDTILTVAAPGVLANDTDAENDSLTAVLVSGASNGNLSLNANGSFTYTPAANFNGSDSFAYKANDGAASSNTATVNITVIPVNDPPTAQANGPYSGTAGVPVQFDASGSGDIDGTLTAYAWNFGDGGTANGTSPTHTYATTGTYTVVLTVTDNNNATGTASTTASIQATPNQAPTASGDAYSTNEDAALSVSAPGVLGNDSDPDGDPLTAVLVTNVTRGSLTLNANGSFTYTPQANFNGSDSFTYRANDGQTNSNAATVTITVSPVNDAPKAANDAYSTNQNQALNVAAPGLLANDSDPDGDPLTAILSTGPSNGSLTLNANGSFTYTPQANFSGNDSFTYRANDGQANSNLATVTITVNAVNETPVVAITSPSDGATFNPGATITFSGTASDAEDGDLSASLAWTSDRDGSLGTGASIAATLSNGTHTITASVTDSGGASGSDQIVITVATPIMTWLPSDDATVYSNDPTGNYGAAPTLEVRAHKKQTAQSYLKFELSNLSAPVSKATLRLYSTTGTNSTVSVFAASNNYRNTETAWTESGLNWNNAPSISGSALASTNAAASGVWVEFDVTPALTTAGSYSFAIGNDSPNWGVFSSKEAAEFKPQLVVELQAAP